MPSSLHAPLLISLGAILGALSRYYLTLWLNTLWGSDFPYGTLVVNLTGCLGMGLLSVFLNTTSGFSPNLKWLMMTGFLGAYTTFSTYGLETVVLGQRSVALALVYWLGSASLGVLCILMGGAVAKIFSS
jgi:fluoride exporter